MKQIIDGIEKIVTVSDDLRDYQFSQMEELSGVLYLSFINAKGDYYFKKITDTSCTFYRSSDNYSNDWADRANKTYSLFNEVF